VPAEASAGRACIRRLAGVYNADGTLRGELTYWIGARFGQAHCALCDITHGLVRERADWKSCRARLPVHFDTYHRNDQPDDVRAVIADRTPAVLAQTDRGLVVLLGPDDLERCASSPEELRTALESAAAADGLRWP
jgi:hypothetical protein